LTNKDRVRARETSNYVFKLPFGEELFAGVGGRTTAQGYSQPDGVRMKFTGKERDTETGLDYFGARYYSSTQGRFTSVDPENAGADGRYQIEVHIVRRVKPIQRRESLKLLSCNDPCGS
jgi:RHS repeat-associated protein